MENDLNPLVKEIKSLLYRWKKNGHKPHDLLKGDLKSSKKRLKSKQRTLLATHRNNLLTE